MGKKKPETVRWSEGTNGCTFSADSDGKYRWGMWNGDTGVVLAIDSQELQFSRKRLQHALAVLVTVRYRGTDKLQFTPRTMSVEFVNHRHQVVPALDPNVYSGSLQTSADTLEYETVHQMRKHPEKKDEQEAALREYQQQVSDLVDFIQSRSLHASTLDPENKEDTGWVYFGTQARWVGDMKTTEEFVFRIPIAGRVMEIPVTMPPDDNFLLRRR